MKRSLKNIAVLEGGGGGYRRVSPTQIQYPVTLNSHLIPRTYSSHHIFITSDPFPAHISF